MITIDKITVHHVNMRMKNPFTTSFGTEQDRSFLVLEIESEAGVTGWGECVTSSRPLYIEEFTTGAWHMLKEHLIPLVLKQTLEHPNDLQEIFAPFKRNHLAKSAIEGAVWDLYAKTKGQTLSEALGGTKQAVEVGVSLGIEDNLQDLLRNIEEKVDEGYKRIKIKIKPGKDIDVLHHVRDHYPDIPLMVDANSAYTLDDLETLKEMDQFDLMMIEQPLMAGDLIDHATLQKEIETPVCLDESIHSYEDARQAIELGSGKIINMKIARVGGLTQAKKIHDMCVEANIPLWCGGMLEAGIGRLHNIAVASLANFTLPGDTASSSRYWEKDIINPEVVAENGLVNVPEGIGIGHEVDRAELEKNTVKKEVFN